MKKLDDIVVTDDAPPTGFGKSLCRDNLPVVVCVVVAVTCNLLAYGLVKLC
jgi:hypothetical protein